MRASFSTHTRGGRSLLTDLKILKSRDASSPVMTLARSSPRLRESGYLTQRERPGDKCREPRQFESLHTAGKSGSQTIPSGKTLWTS